MPLLEERGTACGGVVAIFHHHSVAFATAPLDGSQLNTNMKYEHLPYNKNLKSNARDLRKSMTKQERRNPSIITLSRKERIAKGCGKDIAAVNRLLKQFEESKKMMSMLGNFDPNTGMPTHGIKSKNPHVGNANRKKVRHKKKKKK